MACGSIKGGGVSDGVVEALLVIGLIFVLAAASAAALEWRGLKVPPIAETRPRLGVAVLGVAALVVGVIGAFMQVSPNPHPQPVGLNTSDSSQPTDFGTTTPVITVSPTLSDSPSFSPIASSSPQPLNSATTARAATAPAVTASPAHPVWNDGKLTLSLGMNADLESKSSDFDRAPSMNWPPGDVAYNKSPDGAPGYTLFLADSPATTAVLATGGTWSYRTCADAQYGGDGNAPWQGNIAAGHGLCFHPQDGRYILLRVISQDSQQITLEVTSWTL